MSPILKRILIGMSAIVLILVVFCGYALVRFSQDSERFSLGISFSDKYARSLGIDVHAAYTALLDDMGVRRVRLMSYWDEIEPQPGAYDFNELDWEMDQAAQRGAAVSLSIGQRQPRYPECHVPDWATKLSGDDRNARLNDVLKTIIDRYKGRSNLVSYQLENEALNTTFGVCTRADRNQLQAEFDLVKRLDPDHPVQMNLSDEWGLPLGGPHPDIYGFSVYRRYYENHMVHRYWLYPIPSWGHRLRAAIIEAYSGKQAVIHELQAEPWGPSATVGLSFAEQDKSMSKEQLVRNVETARRTGIREADMWGAEWWYWRKQQGDNSIWNTAKDMFDKYGAAVN
jgi:hypothetical protein